MLLSYLLLDGCLINTVQIAYLFGTIFIFLHDLQRRRLRIPMLAKNLLQKIKMKRVPLAMMSGNQEVC